MAIEGKSLIKGFLILAGIAAAAIGLYVLLPIGGLVVGSITSTAVGTWNGTTGSGAVNVSDGMKIALAGYETSYIADTNSITSNTGVIIGLVAIVVIIIAFGLQDFFKGMFKKGVN